MKILITGSSSYIAKYVIDRFLDEGYEIIGISRTDNGIRHENFKQILFDLSTGIPKIEEKIYAVVHMAAQSLLDKKASEYFYSNLAITENVRKLCETISPEVVFYTSSYKVYGEIQDGVLTEESPIINPCLYGITKYYGEKLLEESVPTISFRLPGVLAKGSHGWIDKVHNSLLRNEQIKIINSRYNHLIHALDIFRAIKTIIESKNYTSTCYNASISDIATSLDVVMYLKNRISSSSEIQVFENRLNGGFIFSNKKIEKIVKPMSLIEALDIYLSEYNK